MAQGHTLHTKTKQSLGLITKHIMVDCQFFWPYHLHTKGDVNAMIFLEKCSAHTLSEEENQAKNAF